MMKTVILAAGFGSRLWPLSTSDSPKQFQPLVANRSLLQYSYSLFGNSVDPAEIHVLTLSGLEHHIYKQIPEIHWDNIILLPDRGNTLPNTLFALNKIADSIDEPVLFSGVDIFFPEPEHHTKAINNFHIAQASGNISLQESIVLFGTPADVYDPNCGYVLTSSSDNRVIGFLEKPSRLALEHAIGQNTVYKSSFVFCGSIRSFSRALTGLDGDMAKSSMRLLCATHKNRSARFTEAPCLDISHALFQKATNLVVQPIESSFIDLGRYVNLFHLTPPDAFGNRIVGNVIIAGDCMDNLIINRDARPLVVRHIQRSVVVQAKGGTLISPLHDVDEIGELYKSKIDQCLSKEPTTMPATDSRDYTVQP